MVDCPCCSTQLLRHIRSNQIVYFCRHCWQEMPVFERSICERTSPALAEVHGGSHYFKPLSQPAFSRPLVAPGSKQPVAHDRPLVTPGRKQ